MTLYQQWKKGENLEKLGLSRLHITILEAYAFGLEDGDEENIQRLEKMYPTLFLHEKEYLPEEIYSTQIRTHFKGLTGEHKGFLDITTMTDETPGRDIIWAWWEDNQLQEMRLISSNIGIINTYTKSYLESETTPPKPQLKGKPYTEEPPQNMGDSEEYPSQTREDGRTDDMVAADLYEDWKEARKITGYKQRTKTRGHIQLLLEELGYPHPREVDWKDGVPIVGWKSRDFDYMRHLNNDL